MFITWSERRVTSRSIWESHQQFHHISAIEEIFLHVSQPQTGNRKWKLTPWGNNCCARFFWSECFFFYVWQNCWSNANSNNPALHKFAEIAQSVQKNKNKIKQKSSETRPKRKGSCLHSAARCNINEISVQSVAKQRRRRVALSVMGLGNSSAVSITLSTRRPEGKGGFLRVILC